MKITVRQLRSIIREAVGDVINTPEPPGFRPSKEDLNDPKKYRQVKDSFGDTVYQQIVSDDDVRSLDKPIGKVMGVYKGKPITFDLLASDPNEVMDGEFIRPADEGSRAVFDKLGIDDIAGAQFDGFAAEFPSLKLTKA